MLWGFSEALDFYEEYTKNVTIDTEPPSQLNILLFGSSDPRHIIKTLAKSYKHGTKLHFYVLEGCPALVARQIILLSITLEPSHLLTLPHRTHLFMDIYGNTLIRSTSMGYMESKVNHLIKCVTDLEFNVKMQPIFDLTHLKFIERDCLESVFSFWRERDTNPFDIRTCWIQRLRQTHRDRFDARQGAYDWDHQMRLKDNGAHQICSQEYKHWRETGVAFTFPEYRQSHANKTFALQPSKANAGDYVGDTTIGPFCGFGLSCHDQKLLKSNYGQNEYRATDISESNLIELFYEIQERTPPNPDTLALHKLGMTKIDTGKSFGGATADKTATQFNEKTDLKKFNEPLMSTNQVTVSFLPMSDAQSLVDGNKFIKKFDAVFVGRNYFPIVKKDFSNVFQSNALILFETAQMSTQRKPEIAEFLMKIRDMAKTMNLTPITNFNINLPLAVAKFSKRVTSSLLDQQQ
ncbi:dynein axonemal assembly factor 3 homolog [Sitodiplosis mosellana]|uniref:dynein axonemal assembly factor 3 homolog n=1 Tax=Sitodiplosis mosellana TaxID=263140 RepID=UPI0024443DDC|nr:dynein axonemal assembly factor 3 homolog [Sitodiplosis mosellana]